MDFSSTERALSSLERRTPKLSPKTISLATELKSLFKQPNCNPLDTKIISCTTDLLNIGTNGCDTACISGTDSGTDDVVPASTLNSDSNSNEEEKKESRIRWEPLAVGFYLTASFLQSATTFYQNQKGGGGQLDGNENGNTTAVVVDDVYMDGPRVPNMAKNSSTNVDTNDNGITSDSLTGASTTIDVDVDEDQLSSFSQLVMSMCQTHLEHNEPRVRSLVAKVVGQHTKLGTALLSLSTLNSTPDTPHSHPLGQIIIDRSIALYKTTNQSLKEHLASGRDTLNKSKSSEGALDDTTGWRALETNLFAIGSFVHASSDLYFQLVDDSRTINSNSNASFVVDEVLLKDIEYCCVTHVNRHVRAAGIALLEQLVHACASSFRKLQPQANGQQESDNSNDNNNSNVMDLLLKPEATLRQCIIKVLKITLSDNWSQVRMAGSVLCRVFYVTLLDYAEQNPAMINNADEWLTTTYPLLLPRMCLNRFYLAQGVKLYSHDTWRILFQRTEGFGCAGGVESVALNAGPICRYYVKMCDADNHVVREAACQAVAELAAKLGRSDKFAEYLAPYVVMLLQALLMCFHDESWPVRDEACLACGTFCLAYPEECRPELPVLFSRWTEQLTDQIWSVREDAAVALGDAIEAYGASMFDQVIEVLRKDLPSAKNQPSMTREEYKNRQNDIESHTNSQLYSCGSLAPKLRKGGAGRIGCSDCLITRPKAPWEATDGCIYLIRELCVRLCTNGPNAIQEGVVLTDDFLLPVLTELGDVCRVRHFPQSDDLRATLWKQLPFIARALGKQRFKRHYLNLYLELLIKNMENRSDTASQLSVHAAGQCAEELSKFVGVGIFRGRLEEDWQRDVFDRAMEERKRDAISLGPGPQAFSPFGPIGGIVMSTGNNMNESKAEWSPPAANRTTQMMVPTKHVNVAPVVPGNSQFETL